MASGDERLTKKEHLALIVKSVFSILLIYLAIFLCAGRLDYWQGWALCGVIFVIVVVSLVDVNRMPGLARERMRPGPGIKRWDVVILSIYAPLTLGLILFAATDAGRFGWTGPLPVWVYAAGWALSFASWGLVFWATERNPWFSSVVRIQSDRGQRVVKEGPYRFVRHPGYLGGIGGFSATSVVLGSLWGLIGAGLIAILLIVRTALEDRMLIRELPGYADYAKDVRWRLVPGIW
jgi:protein-S-isoprenylcysteine O-methyltransferase Ste14